MIHVGAVEFGVILPLRADVLRDGQPMEAAHFAGDHDGTTLHLARGTAKPQTATSSAACR